MSLVIVVELLLLASGGPKRCQNLESVICIDLLHLVTIIRME